MDQVTKQIDMKQEPVYFRKKIERKKRNITVKDEININGLRNLFKWGIQA